MTIKTKGTIVVLDPTAKPRELHHAMAPRLPDLRGRAVGFLWNSKPNGDILFARLEELLRQKFEITNSVHRSKPTASIPAKEQDIDDLAASCDAVVVGLGD